MGFFSSLGIKNSNQNDFLNYSDDELYNQFKSENWEKLTNDNDKLALLQEIENRDAKEMQRPPATVIWEPRDSERLGGWNCRGNIISIKIDDNQYEMLDSLKHEGEHAVQDYSPSSSSKISKEDKDLMNVENEISINGKDIHYRYYDDDLYDLMTSELDSNSKAFLFMSSQQDRFKSDEKFLEYVQGRKEHFEEVADKIDQLQLEKREALLATVNNNKKLSNTTSSKRIETYINNCQEYTDSYEEKTKEINEVLRNIEVDFENKTINTIPKTTNQILYTPSDSLQQEVNNNQTNVYNNDFVDKSKVDEAMLKEDEVEKGEIKTIESPKENIEVENNNAEIVESENNETIEEESSDEELEFIGEENEISSELVNELNNDQESELSNSSEMVSDLDNSNEYISDTQSEMSSNLDAFADVSSDASSSDNGMDSSID